MCSKDRSVENHSTRVELDTVALGFARRCAARSLHLHTASLHQHSDACQCRKSHGVSSRTVPYLVMARHDQQTVWFQDAVCGYRVLEQILCQSFRMHSELVLEKSGVPSVQNHHEQTSPEWQAALVYENISCGELKRGQLRRQAAFCCRVTRTIVELLLVRLSKGRCSHV